MGGKRKFPPTPRAMASNLEAFTACMVGKTKGE